MLPSFRKTTGKPAQTSFRGDDNDNDDGDTKKDHKDEADSVLLLWDRSSDTFFAMDGSMGSVGVGL